MSNVKAIILAGGKGTRMKSELPKVLHQIYDKSIIDYVVNASNTAGIHDLCIIVGHKASHVIEHFGENELGIKFCIQKEQLGTGHAVMQAEEHIKEDDIVLVINGDMPLISSQTLKSLLSFYEQGNYGGVMLSGISDNLPSYGRVVRDIDGNLVKIVEKKDCNEDEEKINEVNIGVYCFRGDLLKQAFSKLNNNNAQKEYYITDIPYHIMKEGFKFGVLALGDISESQGINSREELSMVTKSLLKKIRKKHMDNGVTLIDPDNTYISINVIIGKDTIIYPGTNIQGETKIGEGCIIGPNTHIISSKIGNFVNVESSKVDRSSIDDNSIIGPFANVRPGTNVSNNCKVGTFVEVKNSTIQTDTKIAHLTYIGDSNLGKNVEIGCGVSTANMNVNYEKNTTIIEDNAFIGCNSTLIAPVKVGKNAVIAAGSVISEDVEPKALAIARSRQVNKPGYIK